MLLVAQQTIVGRWRKHPAREFVGCGQRRVAIEDLILDQFTGCGGWRHHGKGKQQEQATQHADSQSCVGLMADKRRRRGDCQTLRILKQLSPRVHLASLCPISAFAKESGQRPRTAATGVGRGYAPPPVSIPPRTPSAFPGALGVYSAPGQSAGERDEAAHTRPTPAGVSRFCSLVLQSPLATIGSFPG